LEYSEQGDTRFEMFNGNFRKVDLFLDDGFHITAIRSGGRPNYMEIYKKALKAGSLPVEVTSDKIGDNRSLFLNTDDHKNLRHNQTNVGMAVETLLQHLRVEYIVDNQIAGKAYRYDPASNSLIDIDPFNVRVRENEYRR
jgi:hypothetical protein